RYICLLLLGLSLIVISTRFVFSRTFNDRLILFVSFRKPAYAKISALVFGPDFNRYSILAMRSKTGFTKFRVSCEVFSSRNLLISSIVWSRLVDEAAFLLNSVFSVPIFLFSRIPFSSNLVNEFLNVVYVNDKPYLVLKCSLNSSAFL